MADIEKRLTDLETQMRSLTTADIWIDWNDCKVRIDSHGKRGEAIEYPSVFQAAAAVEARMRQSEHVTGLVSVSNVLDLFEDKPFVYQEDATETGVIMNLAAWRGDPLKDVALASWKHMHGLIDSHGMPITRGKAENLPPPSEDGPTAGTQTPQGI